MAYRVLRVAGFTGLVVLVFLIASLWLQRSLPAPTGPYAVGRTLQVWVDATRSETLSEQTGVYRQVPVVIWYPASPTTTAGADYFPNLSSLAKTLVASGEVSALEVFGLRFIRSHAPLEAPIAGSSTEYPVLILSPGNGTNVEFYSGIAEELASHGYVVVGLNHPFDVAAVRLQDGSIAQFAPGPLAFSEHEAWIADRMAVRTEDILFVLEQIAELNAEDAVRFKGRLDLERVAVMGHSLGGVGAAQACRVTSRFRSCLNLDGIQRGGPFSTQENSNPPDQPFMMITKEENLPPATKKRFEAIPSGTYLVVIHGASHDSFTDGPVLTPSLLPLPNQADRIFSLVREYALSFFDQTLKGIPSPLLASSMESELTSLEVYPPH
jgi:dienelactone hydrolase